MLYKFIRNILFNFDAEKVHHFSMHIFNTICKTGGGKWFMRQLFFPKNMQPVQFLDLPFRNSIGLAAGFDKNAAYLPALETLGFGFVEIGTVTPLPQPGNERPRLFRLPKDQAIINRMGFNNEGVEKAVEKLKVWKAQQVNFTPDHPRMIIGGNIGKNKLTPNEDAWKDYEICFRALFDWVDYFVVNVSSPNTPGLRALQEKSSLHKILTHLQAINAQMPVKKPILLKIAPDLTKEQIDDVVDLAMEIALDGLVSSNTTISREDLTTPQTVLEKIGAGGLSGKPLRNRATEIVSYIHKATQGKLPIIASGGIFNAEDVKDKTTAGAGLVQVWTGFIYEGPAIVKNICNKL